MRGRDRHHGPHLAHPARGRHRPVRGHRPVLGWRSARAWTARGDHRPVRRVTLPYHREPKSDPRLLVHGDGWRRGGRLWAVGYARTPSTLRPLVVRKSPSGGWREVDTPRRRAGATLTDVGSDGTAGTWAVGYAIGKPGRHAPWALRWTSGRFVDRSPELASGEHGRLTAVSVSTAGGTWIAGSVARDGIDHPYIARWHRAAPGSARPCRTSGRAPSRTSTCDRPRSGGPSGIARRDRVSSRSPCAGTGRAGRRPTRAGSRTAQRS